MPIDTSKQASMYLKGYVQNIWERDAAGEVVVPVSYTHLTLPTIYSV